MSVIGHEGQQKIRITGSLMQNYVHKAATLLGDVIKVESDGKRATIRTTDDAFIQLIFSSPLMTALTPNCLIEAYGVVMSRNQFQCHDFTQFPQEMSEKFDRQIYNEFVAEFVKLSDQHINCMNTEEHEGSIIVPNDNFSMPQMAANDGFNTTSDMSFSHF